MNGISRSLKDKAGGLLLPSTNITTYVNNFAVAIDKNKIKSHDSHVLAKMKQSSTTVFIGGKGIVRANDRATCGHKATGSNTVFSK